MSNQRTAGDERRALALIQHHLGADIDGLNAILQEAADTGRVGQLIIDVLYAYEELLPLLYAESGRDALVEQVSAVAGGSVAPPVVVHDLSDDDVRRGARLIVEHSVRNGAAVEQIIFERPSVSPLLVAVMSLYSVLAPALNTHVATELLHDAALRAAELEVAEGE